MISELCELRLSHIILLDAMSYSVLVSVASSQIGIEPSKLGNVSSDLN